MVCQPHQYLMNLMTGIASGFTYTGGSSFSDANYTSGTKDVYSENSLYQTPQTVQLSLYDKNTVSNSDPMLNTQQNYVMSPNSSKETSYPVQQTDIPTEAGINSLPNVLVDSVDTLVTGAMSAPNITSPNPANSDQTETTKKPLQSNYMGIPLYFSLAPKQDSEEKLAALIQQELANLNRYTAQVLYNQNV